MEILFLVLLVIVNGVFAMSELAIVSAKRARLKAKAERGDRGAAAALALLDDPSRMLATIQIGITLIGIVAGAYGAAAIAGDLAALIADIAPALQAWSGDIAFGVVIVLTTYLSLVLGELVPKRLAMLAPEAIARAAAPGVSFLAGVSRPVVWLLKISTDGVLKLVGAPRAAGADVTEEDIHALIEEGRSAGVIEPEEREMIAGVLRLGDRTVRAVMTPRPNIVWLDADQSSEEILATIRESGHSRFPVAEGGVENVIGVVQAKELLTRVGEAIDVRAAMHRPVVVPESMSVLRLLETMRESAVRMLMVADEFGGIEGLVTAADVLESIAGDVALSEEEAIDEPVRRADGSWLLDGMTPIDEFESMFDLDGLSESGQFDTLAGLVLSLVQRLPTVGDTVELAPLQFEVVDMDGRRIDKVLVRRVEDADPAG
ncbi:MAG: hemolysin family protein [Caulobacterales bacterium]|nr:hemolysin family protein [Caulobacterales bacterium]